MPSILKTGASVQDGSSQECDILVAADGRSSKLRACLLPDEEPLYSGIVMLAVRAPLPVARKTYDTDIDIV